MEDEVIEVEVKISKTVETMIPIHDVLDAINNLPSIRRLNCVGKLLNDIVLDLSELTEEQRQMCKTFLEEKLKLFNT